MKRFRFTRIFLLAALAAGLLLAQHSAPAEGKAEEAKASTELLWKSANFLILAGLLGYFIRKKAGAFFLSRTQAIRKDIDEAGRQRREADGRFAEIEARLKNLDAEIEALRQSARGEMAAESERLRQETADGLRKIREQSAQDVLSAAKAARHEVKTYAADLAIGLAAGKIRSGLTPSADEGLILAFLYDIEKVRGGKPKTELN